MSFLSDLDLPGKKEFCLPWPRKGYLFVCPSLPLALDQSSRLALMIDAQLLRDKRNCPDGSVFAFLIYGPASLVFDAECIELG